MYAHSKSTVSINGSIGTAFDVKVGVHQGSVLNPLLFIIVMEALSRDNRSGLPWELLYADDLALMADNLQDLEVQYTAWKQGIESKGLRVNIKKTKVMISDREADPITKSGKYPCGVCKKGVGSNSIFCPSCKCWVHHRCSKVAGKLAVVANFTCPSCVRQTQPAAQTPSSVTLAGCNLEVVEKFCYLGDMLEAGGGAEASSVTRVQCGWKKFRDLLPLLGSKAVSLETKGDLYRSCIQPVLLYGSETWPSKAEVTQRLARNEMSMVRWMCGATTRVELSNVELLSKAGITPITELMRRGRLRWYGHVARKDECNWLKRVQRMEVPGCLGKGRPPKSWSESLREDFKTKRLKPVMAQDRNVWRRVIAL